MTRITVRISVDHGNEGANLAESTTVAEGDSARAALRLLLAEVMKRSDLVLPPEQGITTDAEEISVSIDGEPVADASADEGESLSEFIDRVNRILPELEDLVARLRTPRPKAPVNQCPCEEGLSRVQRDVTSLRRMVARLQASPALAPKPRTSEPCSARGLDGECCRLPLGHGGLHRDGDVHWNL